MAEVVVHRADAPVLDAQLFLTPDEFAGLRALMAHVNYDATDALGLTELYNKIRAEINEPNWDLIYKISGTLQAVNRG